jgi:hypothetical protein
MTVTARATLSNRLFAEIARDGGGDDAIAATGDPTERQKNINGNKWKGRGLIRILYPLLVILARIGCALERANNLWSE